MEQRRRLSREGVETSGRRVDLPQRLLEHLHRLAALDQMLVLLALQ